jgi:ABC-2 type transport system ATP-binding protein
MTSAVKSQATISVDGLSKTFQVAEREGGMGSAFRSFVKRKYKAVEAVKDVSFSINQGEIVGFLGPNGAGKTTTLKMLSGLLHPTMGTASVAGHTPWKRESNYLSKITLVMGQRNRLSWDIPAADSFLLNQAIYRIGDAEYKRTFDELRELLDLESIIKKPVRQLSLGERMKCELAAALLHGPSVLFLDEPTIGLDIGAQQRIRAFLAEYNRRRNATIILTSHYMADVTALCERVIIIHHGQLKYDGSLSGLTQRIAPYKLITVQIPDPPNAEMSGYGDLQPNDDPTKYTIRVPADQVAPITSRVLAAFAVQDVTIEDPPIESVIESAFNE